MKNLGAVLGWKFNGASGIRTRNDILTGWPDSLGARPSQAQIDVYATQYEKYMDEMESINGRSEKIQKDRERKEAVRQLKLEGKTFAHFDDNGVRK